MKMSKLKLALIISFSVVTLALVGGIFYAKSKITPALVREQTLVQLEKTFPGADIELGKIDLSIGFSLGLEIEKLKLALKKGKTPLFSVADLEVKIPVISILLGGGSVDINLKNPSVHYREFTAKSNNWTRAMAKGKKTGKKKVKASAAKKTSASSGSSAKVAGKAASKNEVGAEAVAIPAFLSGSKLNLKLTGVDVTYRLKDKSKGKVLLTKFLVKNLNLKTATAFELNSKIDLGIGPKERIKFETLVIGEFNLKDIIDKQEFYSNIVIKLKDFEMTNAPLKVPDINTNLKVELKKNGDLKGTVTTTFMGSNKIFTNYAVTKKGILLSGLNIELKIADLLSTLKDKVPVSAGASELKINGSVNVNSKNKIYPDIKMALSPGVVYSQGDLKVVNTFNGSYKGSRIRLTLINEMLGGSVETLVSAQFNLNQKKFNLGKMKPFLVDVSAKNMVISESFIQKTLYPVVPESEKKKAEASAAAAESSSTAVTAKASAKKKKIVKRGPPIVVPPGTTNISWRNIKIGQEGFSGKGKIKTSTSGIDTKFFNFKFSKGEGKLTHSTRIRKGNLLDNKFTFNLEGLKLASLKVFMPPMLEAITGTFSGKVNGNLKLPENGNPRYNVNVKVSAIDGTIKGLDLSSKVSGVFAKIPGMKGKSKKFDIPEGYETLLLNGRFQETKYNISKIHFVGIKKKVDIKGSGPIYPPPLKKDADLKLSIIEHSFLAPLLQKEAKTNALPIRLKGPGFALTPDYAYTTKKLAKGVAKTRGKKALKKGLNKFLKGKGGGKVDKLLKGLFN